MKIHKWENYINNQKYSDCQIVTAVNAYYYLTGKQIKYNSPTYRRFVELTGAKYGSAIQIERIYDDLKLCYTEYDDFLNFYRLVEDRKFPIEITVDHKRHGRHSVLVIDYEPKCNAYQITNFSFATTKNGWIFWEDLNQFVVKYGNAKTIREVYLLEKS